MTRVLLAADSDALIDHLEDWTIRDVWVCATADEAWQLWHDDPSRWSAVLTTFSHHTRDDLLGHESEGPAPGCPNDATMTGLGLLAAIHRHVTALPAGPASGVRLVAVVADGAAWGVGAMFASVANLWFDADVLDLSSPTAPRGRRLLDVLTDTLADFSVPEGFEDRADLIVQALRTIQDHHGLSGPKGTVQNAVLYLQGNLRRRFMPSPVRSYLALAFQHHNIDGAPPSKPTLRRRLQLAFNTLVSVADAFGRRPWPDFDNPAGAFWNDSWARNGPRAFIAEAEDFFSYDDVVAAWRDGADRLLREDA